MPEISSLVEKALTTECGSAVVASEFATQANRAAITEAVLDPGASMARRDRAIYLMGLWPDDDTVNTISLVLQEVDEEGRTAAASVLGRIPSPAAVSALGELATDRDPDVRRVALNSLGRIGTPEALERVRQVASSDESNINRARASELLDRMPQ